MIALANGVPRSQRARSIGLADIEWVRHNNGFYLSGTDPRFPDAFDERVVVFLEYVQASGAFDIVSDVGTIANGMGSFVLDHSPIRLDGGVQLIGNIIFAKGFFINF